MLELSGQRPKISLNQNDMLKKKVKFRPGLAGFPSGKCVDLKGILFVLDP